MAWSKEQGVKSMEQKAKNNPLSCAGSTQDCRDGLGKDFQIEPQRPMINIVHIQFHPLVKPDRASAVDLPEARNARPNAEATAVPRQVKGKRIKGKEQRESSKLKGKGQKVKGERIK